MNPNSEARLWPWGINSQVARLSRRAYCEPHQCATRLIATVWRTEPRRNEEHRQLTKEPRIAPFSVSRLASSSPDINIRELYFRGRRGSLMVYPEAWLGFFPINVSHG